MKASTLIYLTDVEGVFINNSKIDLIKVDEGESILKSIGFGMNRKVMTAINAVKMGVSKAIITSGNIENPVTKALNNITGTVIL